MAMHLRNLEFLKILNFDFSPILSQSHSSNDWIKCHSS